MTGAGTGKLVGIDEESSVGITGVDREHSVVHVLLGALAFVAWGEESAGAVGVEAGLQPGGLSVVVVAISVAFGDVLEDDSPVAFDVYGTGDLGIVDVRGAQVTFGANPVGSVVLGRSLRGSGVVLVVEGILLVLGDVFDEVVSRLIGHISVLLQEKGVLGNLVGDVIGGVLGVEDAIGKVRTLSTLGWSFGVTVSVMRSRMVGSWVIRCRTVGKSGPHCHRDY